MIQNNNQLLIVDDEPQVRDLTRRALTGYGFECDVACDGEDAIRKASQKSYDAVLTDLRMPLKHGHSLCLDLLEMPASPSILVLTALYDPRLVRDLIGRGVHDVVAKPVNYDILALKVQAMVEHRQLKQRVLSKAPPKKNVAKKINLLHQIETSLVELTELAGERLDKAFDSPGELTDPPKSIREFIRRLAESEVLDNEKPVPTVLPGHDLRGSDRVTCYTTVIAAPVNRHWELTGEPFKLALRDLSEGGARLIHTRATNAPYLALCWNATQLPAKQIRVVCQIRRCKPCGPFYDLGGEFAMAD
ncbi:Nitrogen assimilation regulatory protein [Botrimarina colliarenosi]|uniref:Nitrogen assimilation regulatory protein n=1 Tax=Botrimarina colliarenosi TaxID=2528001 RepID=A0A5C6AHI6_9BACT|nr:response regulator [Botrimarina colliarenosi]TWT99512.1 Nitrogen assimilation regulatory protein [Botrimarina colliarenosi]